MKLKPMIQNIGTFSQVGFASEVCKLLVSSGQWGSSIDVDPERSYAELWVSFRIYILPLTHIKMQTLPIGSIKSVDSWTLGASTACIKKCQPWVKNFIRSQTRLEHTLKLQARWKMEISCPLSFRWNFEGRFSRNNLKFAWIWDSLCRKIQKFWEKRFWQSLDPVFHSSQRSIIPDVLMIKFSDKIPISNVQVTLVVQKLDLQIFFYWLLFYCRFFLSATPSNCRSTLTWRPPKSSTGLSSPSRAGP